MPGRHKEITHCKDISIFMINQIHPPFSCYLIFMLLSIERVLSIEIGLQLLQQENGEQVANSNLP